MGDNFAPDLNSRLAVLGSPIRHSVSPLIHAAAYRELGLPWSYQRIEVTESELPQFLNSRNESWRGLSLTMPLKKIAYAMSNSLDELAKLSGAVNTILFEHLNDGRTIRHGFNTDITGVVESLSEHGITQIRRAAILGAGATATSMMIAFSMIGASEIQVFARRAGAAVDLVELGSRLGVRVVEAALDDFGKTLDQNSSFDLLGNALPGSTEVPFPSGVKLDAARVLFDVTYKPWPSAVSSLWMTAGGSAISGSGMLLRQALRQVRIFLHGNADAVIDNESEVYRAMTAALS